MKTLIILLLIASLASAWPLIYGPAGRPTEFLGLTKVEADSIASDYFTSTDSLYWYNSNYNFYIRQAAGVAGDRDIGIILVEEDGTEHAILFDDGLERIKIDNATFFASSFYGDAIYVSTLSRAGTAGILIDPGSGGVATLTLGNNEADTTVIQSADFLRLESAPLFAEITTPAAVANYGKIYTKNDNQLYFQDGAGVEHIITLVGSDYGEMGNPYGSDMNVVLGTADEWYAVYDGTIAAGLMHGFTFHAGSNGSGTTTTAQGGAGINIADAAHGLIDGDIIAVQSAHHVDIDTVTYVDAGNFEITVAYAADEAITWQQGSYLECNTDAIYRGVWSTCFKQSLANAQTTTISPYINITQSVKAVAIKYLSNTSDVATPGGNGLMNIYVGDRIWFAVQSTSAQTITFKSSNVTLH